MLPLAFDVDIVYFYSVVDTVYHV